MWSKYLSFSFRPDCSVGVPLGLWSWSEWETYLLGLLQVATLLHISFHAMLRWYYPQRKLVHLIRFNQMALVVFSIFPITATQTPHAHASFHNLLKKVLSYFFINSFVDKHISCILFLYWQFCWRRVLLFPVWLAALFWGNYEPPVICLNSTNKLSLIYSEVVQQ